MKREKEYIEAGKKRLHGKRSDLFSKDIEYIMQHSDNKFELISMAFYMGAEAGARITEKKNSRKQ